MIGRRTGCPRSLFTGTSSSRADVASQTVRIDRACRLACRRRGTDEVARACNGGWLSTGPSVAGSLCDEARPYGLPLGVGLRSAGCLATDCGSPCALPAGRAGACSRTPGTRTRTVWVSQVGRARDGSTSARSAVTSFACPSASAVATIAVRAGGSGDTAARAGQGAGLALLALALSGGIAGSCATTIGIGLVECGNTGVTSCRTRLARAGTIAVLSARAVGVWVGQWNVGRHVRTEGIRPPIWQQKVRSCRIRNRHIG